MPMPLDTIVVEADHEQGDPRTPRLFRVADEEGLLGPYLPLSAAIGLSIPRRSAGLLVAV
ncbi:hypothetical protein ACWGH3_36230 [Streptomyces sp. NPDC054884]|uniref:hypothetical protein n=1 Tax=Streptomyces sp. ME08-AFT2 TaxID=3028683 RepID=UPI0029A5DEAF|nr:hypothetical protein [Streptomyces sp. ME08-AFT2]MDX3312215.1 hypothetical protein [Streptomyces sp. ME08-AFT2]